MGTRSPTLRHAVSCFLLLVVGSFVLALFLAGNVAFKDGRYADQTTATWVNALVQGVYLLVVLGVIGYAELEARASLALYRSRPVHWLVGAVGILSLSTIVAHVQFYTMPDAVTERLVLFAEEARFTSLGRFLLYLLSKVALTATVEELAFRGLILQGLRRTLGTHAAVILSALAFGAMHPDLAGFTHAFASGVFLGYLTTQTGSITPAISAHAAINLFAVAEANLGTIYEFSPFWLALAAVLFIASVGWLIRSTGQPQS